MSFLSSLSAVWGLVAALLVNSWVVWLIVHFFYYPKSRRRDYYFTYVLLSVSIFMLIFLLLGNSAADIGMGAALGLFAIFGILRYRTESVPIREMNYLFLLVALSVINGKLAPTVFTLEGAAMCLVVNAVFLSTIAVCERLLPNSKGCKYVRYDNIELIRPDREAELIADLRERLGLDVTSVEVGSVDFLQDVTMLKVYYEDKDSQLKSVDREFKFPDRENFKS